jgi:glycerol-3-phosphate dehydrogenase subunit C
MRACVLFFFVAAGKRKALLFPTCLVNYQQPDTGLAAAAVLEKLGVDVTVQLTGCCGMPQLEQGVGAMVD